MSELPRAAYITVGWEPVLDLMSTFEVRVYLDQGDPLRLYLRDERVDLQILIPDDARAGNATLDSRLDDTKNYAVPCTHARSCRFSSTPHVRQPITLL